MNSDYCALLEKSDARKLWLIQQNFRKNFRRHMNTTRFHEQSIVESGATVGKRTRVWAFAHVLGGAIIGEECNICDHTFIEGKVKIGNRVTVKCGVYLWDGLELQDDVFVGPAAAFTNDLRPRSRNVPSQYPKTVLKQGCSIGANATILPGITIGRFALVGAGAVVTRDVADFALVMGNPARQKGWVCRCGNNLEEFIENQVTCACGKRFRLKSNLTESNQIKQSQLIEEINVA